MTSNDLSTPTPDSLSISSEVLLHRMEEGEVFQVMDVRAPERLAQGRLDRVPPELYQNVRGSELIQIHDLGDTGLEPELPAVVVCGHGKDSRVLAAHLARLGVTAFSLDGGLAGWMKVIAPRTLDPPEGLDHFIQFDRVGKGCLGYLLVSQGEAVAVDPPLHFRKFEEALETLEARLVAVADTHVHADYVSGAVPMSRKFGIPYFLHPADAFYPYDGTPGRIDFEPLSDGGRISFGETALQVLHTPGHTEGSVTLLVEDRVALTGDFLFVESIGRPDLGGMEEEWAKQLWDSMVRVIRRWSDGMAVYPAHYASERERQMGQAVGAPFGRILRENEILQIQDPEVFLRAILARKAPFPEAYRKMKALNLGLTPLREAEVEVLELGRNECALGSV